MWKRFEEEANLGDGSKKTERIDLQISKTSKHCIKSNNVLKAYISLWQQSLTHGDFIRVRNMGRKNVVYGIELPMLM